MLLEAEAPSGLSLEVGSVAEADAIGITGEYTKVSAGTVAASGVAITGAGSDCGGSACLAGRASAGDPAITVGSSVEDDVAAASAAIQSQPMKARYRWQYQMTTAQPH